MFFSPFNFFFSRFWFCLNRCSRFHRRHIHIVTLILHILTETRETQFFFKTQQVFIVPIKHVSNRSSRHGVQLSGIAIVVFERKKMTRWYIFMLLEFEKEGVGVGCSTLLQLHYTFCAHSYNVRYAVA